MLTLYSPKPAAGSDCGASGIAWPLTWTRRPTPFVLLRTDIVWDGSFRTGVPRTIWAGTRGGEKSLQSGPALNEADGTVAIAINNSFNNLLGYPFPNKNELWPTFLSAKRSELARIFDNGKEGHEIASSHATILTTCRKPPGPTGVCPCPTANSSSA
jgi:hypothetical protein